MRNVSLGRLLQESCATCHGRVWRDGPTTARNLNIGDTVLGADGNLLGSMRVLWQGCGWCRNISSENINFWLYRFAVLKSTELAILSLEAKRRSCFRCDCVTGSCYPSRNYIAQREGQDLRGIYFTTDFCKAFQYSDKLDGNRCPCQVLLVWSADPDATPTQNSSSCIRGACSSHRKKLNFLVLRSLWI